MRLGFAAKVVGRTGLKSHDSRRWQNAPHLTVSLQYTHAIFDYMAEANLTMYRMPSDLAPYLHHPDMPQFHHQLDEAADDIRALGQRARDMNLRLSFHPSQYIVLNSPNDIIVEGAILDFTSKATILDLMELSDEAVVVTHVGGVYGDRDQALRRFIINFGRLPDRAKHRLVLENDDVSWGVSDILQIHEATGIRCIFDHQHHALINPDGREAAEACAAMIRTWPNTNLSGARPKIHFSTPRVAPRIITRRDKSDTKRTRHVAPALASQHADYIDSDIFLPFARAFCAAQAITLSDIPFDVMCEAKAKDLAVLRLREELRERAPEIRVI